MNITPKSIVNDGDAHAPKAWSQSHRLQGVGGGNTHGCMDFPKCIAMNGRGFDARPLIGSQQQATWILMPSDLREAHTRFMDGNFRVSTASFHQHLVKGVKCLYEGYLTQFYIIYC